MGKELTWESQSGSGLSFCGHVKTTEIPWKSLVSSLGKHCYPHSTFGSAFHLVVRENDSV